MFRNVVLTLLLAISAAAVEAKDAINSTRFGNLAIEGTDPVAYFRAGGPVKGQSDYEYEWNDARWRFSSAENRDLFANDPQRYAPQFGGYCAYAVSQGYTAGIDPKAWTIVDDKLYLNYSPKIQKRWLENRDAYIRAAEENWPGVLN